MKAFYATAEKVLQIQCGNPVVKSVIKEEQLITDRDSVEQAIAEYFEDVYGGKDREVDSEEDLTLWTRLEATTDLMVQLFTTADVTEAMKASNFNKGLGPDGLDGYMLRPGDASHRLTQELTSQITTLLNNPMLIPKYLYEGWLVPLSKNKGMDQAELKDIRPIVVRSHVAKILEKAIMAKVAVLAPDLMQTRIYKTGLKRGILYSHPCVEAS